MSLGQECIRWKVQDQFAGAGVPNASEDFCLTRLNLDRKSALTAGIHCRAIKPAAFKLVDREELKGHFGSHAVAAPVSGAAPSGGPHLLRVDPDMARTCRPSALNEKASIVEPCPSITAS